MMTAKQPQDLTDEQLQKAKEAAATALLRPNDSKNIIGVGIGNKFEDGIDTGARCVRVYVLSKFAKDKLAPTIVVPDEYLGVATDVIEVGPYGQTGQLENVPNTEQIGPGCAIRINTTDPNINSGAFGTLGAAVTAGGHNYILSCNHILAVNGRVQTGRIYSNATEIASFGPDPNRHFVKLKLDGELEPGETNLVDCALGLLPEEDNKVSSDIPEVFDFPGKCTVRALAPIPPVIGRAVVAAGAMSGTTEGTIVDISARGYIDYSFGRFLFDKQVVIDSGDDGKDFAVSGDSGAVVWDQEHGAPVAMIFAAAGRYAVACPLSDALMLLGAKVGAEITFGLTPKTAGTAARSR